MNRTFALIYVMATAIMVMITARLLWVAGIGINLNRLVPTSHSASVHYNAVVNDVAYTTTGSNVVTAIQPARSFWNYATNIDGIVQTHVLAACIILTVVGIVWGLIVLMSHRHTTVRTLLQ